ncbi:MAG TPA: hypothetical protein VFW94_23375 [Candidatus Acidoferrales bacterium]|nr:hypothetical protein [Candidatus Acidoferrales bacterium]
MKAVKAAQTYQALRSECLTVGDYHAILKILSGIPKRFRSKLKRQIKRYAMTVILVDIEDMRLRRKAYRSGWQAFARLARGES